MSDFKIDVSEAFNDNEIEFSKALSQAQKIIDKSSSMVSTDKKKQASEEIEVIRGFGDELRLF